MSYISEAPNEEVGCPVCFVPLQVDLPPSIAEDTPVDVNSRPMSGEKKLFSQHFCFANIWIVFDYQWSVKLQNLYLHPLQLPQPLAE